MRNFRMDFDFSSVDEALFSELIKRKERLLEFKICGLFSITANGDSFFRDEYFNIFEFIFDLGGFVCGKDSAEHYGFVTADYDEEILSFDKYGSIWILSSIWSENNEKIPLLKEEIAAAYDDLCDKTSEYLIKSFNCDLNYLADICEKNGVMLK